MNLYLVSYCLFMLSIPFYFMSQFDNSTTVSAAQLILSLTMFVSQAILIYIFNDMCVQVEAKRTL